MPTVYLDQQIVIESFEGGEIAAAVEAGKRKGFVFPYSPAHVEEIAAAHHRHNRADALPQIPALERLSDGWAIMARWPGPARLCREDIRACLSRVQDDGGRLLTEYAVRQEKARVLGFYENVSDTCRDEIWEELQVTTPRDVFSSSHIYAFIDNLARNENFRIRLDSFKEREATFDCLYNVLNAFGFQKVHSEHRIEGRMHDVSHAIYAYYADMFVTNDGKLRKSSDAIYAYTGVKTQIVDRRGFLELSDTWEL